MKNNKSAAFWLHLFITILEITGFIIAIGNHGVAIFAFYTQLSNMVLLVSSLLYVIICITRGEDKVTRGIRVFQYVSACLVTVTFVTVMTVLLPMVSGYGQAVMFKLVFGEANLYHHFLCPIFAVVAFLVCERQLMPTMKDTLIATAPTLGYAIVTTTLNVAKVIVGPYPFLYVYKQPWYVSVMWFVAIPGFGFLFAWLMAVLNRKFSRNKR